MSSSSSSAAASLFSLPWLTVFVFASSVFFGHRLTTFASSSSGATTPPPSTTTTPNAAVSRGGPGPGPGQSPGAVDPARSPPPPSAAGSSSGETTTMTPIIWKPSGCIKIPKNLTLCRGAGYTRMHLPNLLDHEDIAKVNEQAAPWVPLLNLRCHPDTQIFLCSLFAPICHVRPIWPCKKLCRSVRESCEPPMARYGYPWPEMLSCERFPSDKPDNLCIGKQKSKQHSKGGDRCSACDQPDTLEGIVDHFCRVDTVIRLNVDQLVLSAPNVKIKGSKIKILKNQNKQNKDDLLKIPMTVDAGAKCACAPLWNRSEMLLTAAGSTSNATQQQHLVMGVTRNDRLHVTLLQSFNASSPVTTRVMAAIRKDALCTSGIKLLLQQQQQQQSTKTKKKSKKKETKQKAKTKKKEIKQKHKAHKVQKTAENVTTTTTTTKKPQTTTKKQKPNGKNGDKQHSTANN